MSFCWFTSFIGYPNFFANSGHSWELAKAFITLARASLDGKSYNKSKGLFPELDHAQVETKKAAFQEYGLLYVVPRSNTISLTPIGHRVYDLLLQPKVIDKNRRTILLSLCRALARYQFDNPLPVGGNRRKNRARSSDVLPYLACYYLLHKLGGLITVSELKGIIFGLRQMQKIQDILQTIKVHRKEKSKFEELECLPANRRTSDNLKIYFVSHLGLDFEIIKNTVCSLYGYEEQSFELTESGSEITETILDEQWPNWKSGSAQIPKAKKYVNIFDYFNNGIGELCPEGIVEADTKKAENMSLKTSNGILDLYDVENLKELPLRQFKDGKRRLRNHVRLEKVRNSKLVREAKKYFKMRNKRLFCEVCGFDFNKKYGDRGKDYIEAHHKIPLSELQGVIKLTVNDLAMVCSNCHRMLHRPPWISLEELRDGLR